MSDLHRTPTHQRARLTHRCENCYYPIAPGELYTQQTGFFEGKAYRCRYHTECFEALCDEPGDFTFTPGSGDPPDRLKTPGNS